jgi:hypothetical protein
LVQRKPALAPGVEAAGQRKQHRREGNGVDADVARRDGVRLPRQDARPRTVHDARGRLIVADGKPNLILPQMVKTGAVVIDVGINRFPDAVSLGLRRVQAQARSRAVGTLVGTKIHGIS